YSTPLRSSLCLPLMQSFFLSSLSPLSLFLSSLSLSLSLSLTLSSPLLSSLPLSYPLFSSPLPPLSSPLLSLLSSPTPFLFLSPLFSPVLHHSSTHLIPSSLLLISSPSFIDHIRCVVYRGRL